MGQVTYNVGPQKGHEIAKLGPLITHMKHWFMVAITIVFMGFIDQLTSLGGLTMYEFPI